VRPPFGNGGLVNGGVSLGRTHLDNLGDAAVHNCSDAANNVYYGNTQQRLFCEIDNRQDQVKVMCPIRSGAAFRRPRCIRTFRGTTTSSICS
jgi:hypothetical protein